MQGSARGFKKCRMSKEHTNAPVNLERVTIRMSGSQHVFLIANAETRMFQSSRSAIELASLSGHLNAGGPWQGHGGGHCRVGAGAPPGAHRRVPGAPARPRLLRPHARRLQRQGGARLLAGTLFSTPHGLEFHTCMSASGYLDAGRPLYHLWWCQPANVCSRQAPFAAGFICSALTGDELCSCLPAGKRRSGI